MLSILDCRKIDLILIRKHKFCSLDLGYSRHCSLHVFFLNTHELLLVCFPFGCGNIVSRCRFQCACI